MLSPKQDISSTAGMHVSIKGQLTGLIIATVVLATFFAALHGYRSSSQQLDSLFDQELKSIAQIIASVIANKHTLPAKIDGEIAFQVFSNNLLISKSVNSPSQPYYASASGFNERTFSSMRWRTYTMYIDDHIVVVAQAIESRIASAELVLLKTITPIVLTIPLIAFLVFYIIRKSLASLTSLSAAVSSKSSDDLSVIELENPPLELQAVLNTLNHLLRRVDDSFEREKQLTANAAHELRTPISVLTVNAHNLIEDYNNNELSLHALQALERNVDRMAHVIEQMIAVYRFTPERFRTHKKSQNIQTILQNMIANNFDDIDAQQQSISLQAEECFVLGDEFALYTLFENLLRNSIKYSGQQSEIKLSAKVLQGKVNISVDDSGKGIKEADYDKIFQRFYRIEDITNNQQVEGLGLGLSIVKHIVNLHDGSIKCQKSPLGGLSIQIQLHQDHTNERVV